MQPAWFWTIVVFVAIAVSLHLWIIPGASLGWLLFYAFAAQVGIAAALVVAVVVLALAAAAIEALPESKAWKSLGRGRRG